VSVAATFVTTADNPYNYFTQFDEWYAWDTSHGYDVIGRRYNTCDYVARIADLMGYKSTMQDEEAESLMNDVVDEIVRLNITGNYQKVVEPT
jgi:hypothetical protein